MVAEPLLEAIARIRKKLNDEGFVDDDEIM
jgi:hypothetical protein